MEVQASNGIGDGFRGHELTDRGSTLRIGHGRHDTRRLVDEPGHLVGIEWKTDAVHLDSSNRRVDTITDGCRFAIDGDTTLLDEYVGFPS